MTGNGANGRDARGQDELPLDRNRHEMAKQHSPGLQPWVASNQKPRPERATESLICPDVVEWRIESDTNRNVTARSRSAALSGRILFGRYPGLKPWAKR